MFLRCALTDRLPSRFHQPLRQNTPKGVDQILPKGDSQLALQASHCPRIAIESAMNILIVETVRVCASNPVL